MKSVKRHAYKVDSKLKAIIYAVDQWNRAAAREFNINEPIVQKWRKQEDDLSFRGKRVSLNALYYLMCLMYENRPVNWHCTLKSEKYGMLQKLQNLSEQILEFLFSITFVLLCVFSNSIAIYEISSIFISCVQYKRKICGVYHTVFTPQTGRTVPSRGREIW